MALFKTQEEKATLLTEQYGLVDVDDKDIEILEKINLNLIGMKAKETGAMLGGTNEKGYLEMILTYNKCLYEQNFMLIRQLDRLINIMEEDNGTKSESSEQD